MKKTCGPCAAPSCTRYSHAVSVRSPNVTVNGGPARSKDGAVARTWRYSGSTTVVGMPAAAWNVANPLTASPSPPVRANGQYSAVRWTTPIRSAAGVGAGGAATGPALGRLLVRAGAGFGARVVVACSLPDNGPGSRSRRIVSRELTRDRGDVILGHVLPHHALGGEVPARHTQRMLHLVHPPERHVARVAIVEQRHYFLFEQAVQLFGVGGVGVRAIRGGGNGPPVPAIVPFGPPSVQGAELGHSVQRSLHAARPRRLERGARHVEPQIDALDQVMREVHLVVFQEGDPALEPGFARERVDALEHLLAGLVGRVRFPGEDKLDRAPRVGQQALQPVEIAEDQRRPLVGREPPGEPDRQGALLEQRSGAHQVQRFLPLIRPTTPGIVPDGPQQRPLELAVRLPQGGVLETEGRVPESRLVHPVRPV